MFRIQKISMWEIVQVLRDHGTMLHIDSNVWLEERVDIKSKR